MRATHLQLGRSFWYSAGLSRLPATTLLFPLSLRTQESAEPVVRTILSIDEDQQSMTFAGDLPLGGYARLMKANFDRLIDGAFVQYLTTNQAGRATVCSTVNMAHSLGIRVVAEGVKDRATWDLLVALGCDIAQGYYLSRPVPAQDLERWLRAREEASTPWLDERKEVLAR